MSPAIVGVAWLLLGISLGVSVALRPSERSWRLLALQGAALAGFFGLTVIRG